MEVLNLLRSKNRCLERMLEVTEAFAVTAARKLGEPGALDEFQLKRETVLKALELHDRRITAASNALAADQVGRDLISAVEAELSRRQAIIADIIRADERVFAAIAAEQARITAEINGTHRDRAQMAKVAKFKSSWVAESGEALDETL